MVRSGLAFLALLGAVQARAEPVAVRVVWNGNDALGGIVVNRVRGLIAACCGFPVEAILAMILPDSAAVHQLFVDLAPFLKGE